MQVKLLFPRCSQKTRNSHKNRNLCKLSSHAGKTSFLAEKKKLFSFNNEPKWAPMQVKRRFSKTKLNPNPSHQVEFFAPSPWTPSQFPEILSEKQCQHNVQHWQALPVILISLNNEPKWTPMQVKRRFSKTKLNPNPSHQVEFFAPSPWTPSQFQ